jgi:hypothetical protein
MMRVTRGARVALLALAVLVPVTALAGPTLPGQAPAKTEANPQRALLDRYCVTCHNPRVKAGNLTLDSVDVTNLGADPQVWEKVTRKLKAGVMPPSGRPRPDAQTHAAMVNWLETGLDRVAATRPNPGRTEAFHRLNRTEYRNAVRDLLALEIDVDDYLPLDDASYGFDNIAGVLKLSQSLLERYLSTAKSVARMAVGGAPPAVDSDTYRLQPDSQQHARMSGLPFGTRGGTTVTHLFPQDAEYEIRLEVAGAATTQDVHKVEIAVDGLPVRTFTIGPRAQQNWGNAYDEADKLLVRIPVQAGPHEISAFFHQKPSVLLEQVREPFQNPRISGNDGGPGGAQPALTALRVMGPFGAAGAGDTPSRRRVFVCRPAAGVDGEPCARRILGGLARRAYRRPVRADDLNALLGFYRQGQRETGTFDGGIELALRRMLAEPLFLFRIETDPPQQAGAAAGSAPVYRISDLDLASRLSFFLWSSIPDDELLIAAERGRLSQPAVLRAQVRRMLADPRAEALTRNFAGQWLQLRNMDTVKPGDPFSLTFNDTLRRDLKRETELLFDSIVRENRGVVELLTADYTFLNERVAQHYGIPNVKGMHFRRFQLPGDSPRRGILGHASILTITSHAIRTSPVFRGKWILNTVLGTPPPEPPANVPALVDKKTQGRTLSVRDRMAQHRANPACSACHSLIDPAGFALENFDAIGRWRTVDESYNKIDATGILPDGSKFDGVVELRAVLTKQPDRFVTTMTEKLLTYALGRGVEYYDMPAVRTIVKDAAPGGYRFQQIVQGIVESAPFRMRTAGASAEPSR